MNIVGCCAHIASVVSYHSAKYLNTFEYQYMSFLTDEVAEDRDTSGSDKEEKGSSMERNSDDASKSLGKD